MVKGACFAAVMKKCFAFMFGGDLSWRRSAVSDLMDLLLLKIMRQAIMNNLIVFPVLRKMNIAALIIA